MADRFLKVVLSLFLLNLSGLFENYLVFGLDNGLALTPPMGWMDWERFRCNIDCKKDPDNCISEHLIKQQADRLAEDGYKEAGYTYVSIDDCWSNKKRDPFGNLHPNSTRFPSGMKALADYLHDKGLKLGMYADYGFLTCALYPGSIGYIEQDAKTFASWGVDYLKVDGCFSNPFTFDVGFPKFTKALNATGRPIVLSCEWPLYQSKIGIKPDYDAIAKSCNTWRNYKDVQDSWSSVLNIVDHFAENQDTYIAAAGPGHWNDPDMLVVGDFGLNYEQSKAQFALWSILAAPLIMSNDLRTISAKAKDILLNREVIAVNQDKLGKMGRRVLKQNDYEVWTRPLEKNCLAVLLFNRNADKPQMMVANFTTVGLITRAAGVRDLFEHKFYGYYAGAFNIEVNPTGVVLLKLFPIPFRR
ncbi:alpha-N-acetylgalactosaminidase-like isoform X1 [Montipora foliosa]|uniref:alpha-N-acetylgalactosaminidase-like isoform X1 n=1 Tax=Montipora foliosa TaxID=591990 RepID=UPI0035F103CF